MVLVAAENILAMEVENLGFGGEARGGRSWVYPSSPMSAVVGAVLVVTVVEKFFPPSFHG